MRILLGGIAAIIALVFAGCATSESASTAPLLSAVYCDPCPMPCRHDPTCGAGVVAPKTAGVTFDPPGGTYASAQVVRLSTATRGGAIHYTTDGSAPTAASPVYSAPIPVGSSTTIQAMARAPGMGDSGAAAAAYAIEPPRPPARVVVAKEKIELEERIFFDTGKTTLKPESDPLLDEVAEVMKANPELKRVIVEGHTDDRGAADFNQQLSQGRAEAVRSHLIGHGVEGGRLVAKGYGESRPIADNKTAEGRDDNRRVEFVIAP